MPSPPAPSSPREAWEAWRARRLARQGSPSGWLSVVDRVPLLPGENALDIGIFTRSGEAVVFRPTPGVAATVEAASTGGILAEGDVVLAGGRRYELVRSAGELVVRVRDPQAPALVGFRGIPCFPWDPDWVVPARFEPDPSPRPRRHAYASGAAAPNRVAGVARFEIGGRTCSMQPTIEDSGRYSFLFSDTTNADLTSPYGRFVEADPPEGGLLVIDFNRAYNPPCALSPWVACPLVPDQNRLPLAVRAGELRYDSTPP